jgi:cell wall-associated NlpC family hydrolase
VATTSTNTAYVNVTLATLWAQPGLLRPIDAPSASNPVHIPLWLSQMPTAQRLWLVGRTLTQAAYGVQVVVLAHSGSWTKVAVRGQPTPLNRFGYPGWVPARQLTTNQSLTAIRQTSPIAVVTAKVAWLRDPVTLALRIPVTYATRLYVVGSTTNYWLIKRPTGGTLAVAKNVVVKYPSASSIPDPTGAQVVAAARQFLGVDYLWAGTSAYAFDCSGFTYTLFRRFGIPLPRDADRQALYGMPVPRTRLQPGDLLFFAGPGGTGTVHHVAMYTGSGMMIEAPHTGDVVKIVPVTSMLSEYAGARRYL